MANLRFDDGRRIVMCDAPVRLCGVLRRRNIAYGVAATALVIATVLANTGGAAHAVPSDGHAASVLQDDGLPDPEHVVEAYVRARGWVDRFEAPPLDDRSARLHIENATGVCVILRSAGRVLGTGMASLSAGADPDLMVRRAIGRALSEVLGDPAVAALPEDRRTDVGRLLTMEFEVAGRLEPLLGRAFHQIAQQIEPGLDGVSMRRGDQRAMLFPSQLRATGAAANIQSRLPGLAADLGLAPAELSTLQQRHSVSMHRFRTTHLAQAEPSRFPVETFRGDQVVMLSEVSPESIASLADGIALHLIGKLWTHHAPDGEEAERLALGITGDYHAASDTYLPIVAPPLDQALASLALLRYSISPGADAATTPQARSAAETILRDLATVEPGEDDPLLDWSACAAIVFVLASTPEIAEADEAVRGLMFGATEVVYRSFDPEAGYTVDGRALPAHTQAMLAAAIAQRLIEPGASIEPADLVFARAAIDYAWESAPPAQQVTLLPWIGWAEVAYARAAGEPVQNDDVLVQLRAALEESRAIETDQAPDLHGGFPLTVGVSGSGVRPTAQTSRPAAFFATMLREPDLTPADDITEAIEQHRLTMRFLKQIAVRESLLWSVRNPSAARGGVRSSPWDHRMPTAAQAMSLLAASETLRSLHEIRPANRPNTDVDEASNRGKRLE